MNVSTENAAGAEQHVQAHVNIGFDVEFAFRLVVCSATQARSECRQGTEFTHFVHGSQSSFIYNGQDTWCSKRATKPFFGETADRCRQDIKGIIDSCWKRAGVRRGWKGVILFMFCPRTGSIVRFFYSHLFRFWRFRFLACQSSVRRPALSSARN